MSNFETLSEAKPAIAKQWHPSKNDPLSPQDISAKSTQKVWWLCAEGHEWESSIIGRRGAGLTDASCPVCKNTILVKGMNDFASQLPEILLYWNMLKNTVSPSEISQGNNKKDKWWICPEGHEWQTSVKTMALRKNGYCLVCSQSQIVTGINDLATTHPELIPFWDNDANDRKMEEVTSKFYYHARWKCALGHQWRQSIHNQLKKDHVCDECLKQKAKITGNALDVRTLIQEGHESIVIKGKPQNIDRLLAVQDHWDPTNGLFTIENLEQHSWVKNISWVCPEGHSYLQKISEKMRTYANHGCTVCSGRLIIPGVNDALSKFPELAQYLDSEKVNPDITRLPISSKEIFNWICPQGHKYQQSLRSKLRNNLHLCKVCAGKEIQAGVNDICTTHPDVVSTYWHPVKNLPHVPQEYSKGGHSKVWWHGPCGHEWQAAVHHVITNGRRCPTCAGKKVHKGFNDASTHYPQLADSWHPTKNGDLALSNVGFGIDATFWWQCEKGHEWQATARNRGVFGHGCPNCGRNTSKGEKAIFDFVLSILPQETEVIPSDRKAIGKELDIYIPSKNLAIEFNGVYWHSDKNPKMTQAYHHDKWLACKQQGIQLIQVWEDEWMRKPEVVKSMLAHKLGVSTAPRIAGRKTKVQEVPTEVAREFYEAFHIQGFASGSKYVALTVANDLLGSASDGSGEVSVPGVALTAEEGAQERTVVALVTLKIERTKDHASKAGNIVRYATSANVVGGFTKLLSFVEKNYDLSSMYTFSDNCVSDGGLYASTGFTAVKELKPDYMYVVGNQRYHKFGYRLKRFRTDPDLLWEEGMSERELAQLNGLPRIWDAGKVKWKKEL